MMNPQLHSCVKNYYESDNRILPIIITGSNTSLTQAFLLALQRTLAENDLLDIMPETNYKAAIYAIERWKKEFPSTYEKFKESLDIPVSKFIAELEDYFGSPPGWLHPPWKRSTDVQRVCGI